MKYVVTLSQCFQHKLHSQIHCPSTKHSHLGPWVSQSEYCRPSLFTITSRGREGLVVGAGFYRAQLSREIAKMYALYGLLG